MPPGNFNWQLSFRSEGIFGLSPCVLLLLTCLAGPVDLKIVAHRDKMKLLADPAFYFFNLGCKKLHRVAALCADHVVMRAPVKSMLKPFHTVVELDLSRKSTFTEELQ